MRKSNQANLKVCFIFLFRNNYIPTCLAPYGGPIFSPLAVGGFLKEGEDLAMANHLLATGVSLTFLVSNNLNKTALAPATSWEKKYIEFMKNWTTSSKPDFMEVAFSAERSIQDEIDRESSAEILTMVISYLVMFAYITIALGKFRSFRTMFVSRQTLSSCGLDK